MKRFALIGAILLAIGGGAWALGGSGKKQGATAPIAPPQVVAPGMIEPKGEVVDLGFEIVGRVGEVLVAEGDTVKTGQLIIRLDDKLARANVAKAEAQLAAAKARRDQALAGSRPDEVRVARAEAVAQRALARERNLSRGRAEKLRSAEAVADAVVDGERGQADAAAARAEAAEASYALVRSGSRNEEKREAIAMVAAAEAELAGARAYLEKHEIRAPRDGVILRRFLEPGELVSTTPPTLALTMADTSTLEIRAEVDEADIARVAVGQVGWASCEAYGDRRFAGRVVRLTGELGHKRVRNDDPRARLDTRVREVAFVLDEAAPLPLGLRMEVHFAAGSATVAQK
jgi:HlyD family secretion protein